MRKLASKAGDGEHKLQAKKLAAELNETEQALTRLYDAIEKGFMKADEHLKTRLEQHRVKREALLVQIGSLKRQQQSPLQTITPQKIKAASNILNKRLSEASSYAKAYLQATVSEIRITDDDVSVCGDRRDLAKLVANDAVIEPVSGVPRSMAQWRTGEDSNLRIADYLYGGCDLVSISSVSSLGIRNRMAVMNVCI